MDREHVQDVFGGYFSDSRENWKGCCPFHDEKTPSFYVHKYERVAHCFGCGVSGYVDILAAEHLGITPAEARTRLDISAKEIVENAKTKNLYLPPKSFPESWLAPWKPSAHRYVLGRGFTVDILRAADARYDHRACRQVFPHRDASGTLIGAAGRTCRGEDPKWLFYWNYDKSRNLYRPFLESKPSKLVVVEGIFDYLWFAQHGIMNVVAILGSHATKIQARQIRDLSNDVVLALDNDKAGKEGSQKLYQMLKRTCNVSFVDWPEQANDAMDLPKGELETLIETAQNPVQRELHERRRREVREARAHLSRSDRDDADSQAHVLQEHAQ